MSLPRKEPRANPTEGFRFAKPTPRTKGPRRRLGPQTFAEALAARKAGKGLRRTRMKWRQARRIGRETPAEREHKRLIREARVCAVAKYQYAGRCRGKFEVAHLGPSGGTSAKHGDWTMSTLMCHSHHMQLDGHEKPSVFDRMGADELVSFKEREIHLAREFVAGRRTVSA